MYHVGDYCIHKDGYRVKIRKIMGALALCLVLSNRTEVKVPLADLSPDTED